MIFIYKFLFFYLFTLTLAFTHPGLLVTNADINRIKGKLAANKEPWTASWNRLTSVSFSSAEYKNGAVKEVNRGQNGEVLWHDAAAAFNLALRWKISGDDQYAAAASDILTAWADRLEILSGDGDDAYLTAGLQGYELANAAELLRDYEPFAKQGVSNVIRLLESVFLPMNLDFLHHVLGSQHNMKHFFANWEQCNIASALAIAVLADNQTTWDFAIDYFKNGEGNGAINNAISNIVSEPGTGSLLGQGQESGRDQGHSAMNFQLLGAIGQQAWNQGEDLFAYNNSRILQGAEYFARYNLGNDVPFEVYTNGIVSFDTISAASRGAIRPAWELLYAHYVHIKNLDAPWTAAYLNKTLDYFGGYEGGAGSWGEGSGHYDGLGWGSLLHHPDDSDVEAVEPSAATSAPAIATATPSSISLATASTASTTSTTVASTTASTTTSTAASTTATSSTVVSTLITPADNTWLPSTTFSTVYNTTTSTIATHDADAKTSTTKIFIRSRTVGVSESSAILHIPSKVGKGCRASKHHRHGFH